MDIPLGIIAAFIAMFCWGFGDFMIQKSTRKFGDWETLFIIVLVGAVALFPFVYKDIPMIFSENKTFLLLLGASIILLFAALLDFEALKRGKLSVVEPLWSLEIPVSVLLAFFILKESLTGLQLMLIISLVIGLFLVSLHSRHIEKRIWLEKGVLLALAAALVMGSANFFVGWGSRASNPLVMNWFLSVVLAFASLIYLSATGRLSKFFKDFNTSKKFFLGMSILDNAAWVAFAFAMVLAPIGIAVALSESYIIIAVLLGLYVNKELLKLHQKIGLVIAIVAAVTLAGISI